MSSMKNNPIRHPNNLKLSLLPKEKTLLIENSNKCFYYPLAFSKLEYSPLEKKLWLIESKEKTKAFFGLSRVLLAQSFLGVLLSYRRQLNIVGIGYQAHLEKNVLVLKLGFSHHIRVEVPSFLEVSCPKPRVLVVKGINLQRVNNFAQSLRQCRLPSAYKEKGIYFSGERLKLKQGKKT